MLRHFGTKRTYTHNLRVAILLSFVAGFMNAGVLGFFAFYDNKLHWVRIIGNLSHDDEKNPAYFTGVLKDITIHKQDELRKNDFIAMVSHDLRSPLTSIQAYMQLITLKVKNVEDIFIHSSLARVDASIKKMNRMINGFLTVSGSEEGRIHLELETFEMNNLINEIVEESRFINSGVEIFFTAGPELNLKADRD